MNNPHRILNIIDVQINGQPIEVKAISSIKLGGYQRTSEQAGSGTFFKQTMQPFGLSMAVLIKEDTKVMDFQHMDNITLILTADTGQSYAVSNCWVEQADSIQKSDGTMTVQIAGNPAIEVA